MKSRIVCVILVAMMLALTACGATQSANAPEAETSGTTEDVLYSTEPPSGEESTTENDMEESTTDIPSTGEGTTGTDGTTVAAEVKAPVGGSTAQVVEFYNKYANAVKAAGKITIKKHSVSEMTMDMPTIVSAFMPNNTGDYDPNTDETITETFVNGKGTKDTSRKLNDFLPVTGKSYVSQLKASHIQSASCAKQGEGWIVTIKLKDEPMDMDSMGSMGADMSEADRQKALDNYLAKSGYGSSMEMGFGGGSGGFGGSPPNGSGQDRQPPGNFDASSMSMDGAYKNGSIVAVFNKDGQLTSLTHSYNSNMTTSMMGMKMTMNSSMKQEYQFTW